MPLTGGDNGPYAATCASRQFEKTDVPSLLVTGRPPASARLVLHSRFRDPRPPGPPFAPGPRPRAPRLPAGAGRPPATAARGAQPGSVAPRAGRSHEVMETGTRGSVRILPAHPVLGSLLGWAGPGTPGAFSDPPLSPPLVCSHSSARPLTVASVSLRTGGLWAELQDTPWHQHCPAVSASPQPPTPSTRAPGGAWGDLVRHRPCPEDTQWVLPVWTSAAGPHAPRALARIIEPLCSQESRRGSL